MTSRAFRFESIRRFVLGESIRFVKKNRPYDSAAAFAWSMINTSIVPYSAVVFRTARSATNLAYVT